VREALANAQADNAAPASADPEGETMTAGAAEAAEKAAAAAAEAETARRALCEYLCDVWDRVHNLERVVNSQLSQPTDTADKTAEPEAEATRPDADDATVRAAVDSALAGLKKAGRDLCAELNDARDERADMRGDLEDAIKSVADAKAESGALRTALEKRKQALEDADVATAETETKLADAETKLADTESKLADVESKLAEAEKKVADAEAKAAEAEKKAADAESKVSAAEAKAADAAAAAGVNSEEALRVAHLEEELDATRKRSEAAAVEAAEQTELLERFKAQLLELAGAYKELRMEKKVRSFCNIV